MTADEMFKELGYQRDIYNITNIEYYKYNNNDMNDDIQIIRFYNRHKMFWCNYSTTMQELKAINKKVEELGWNV